MDTSIRLYTTNSRWGPSTEDESQGHSAISLPADKHDGEGLVDKEEENAETSLSEPSTITQPEQVNIADFEAIFLRYQGPITNFIYHLLGNREQAYDLAQDVFVKAYKALLGGTVATAGCAISMALSHRGQYYDRYATPQTADFLVTIVIV